MIHRKVIDPKNTSDLDAWNETILKFENYHILQSFQWGGLKRNFGWIPHFLQWEDSSGSIVGSVILLEREYTVPIINRTISILYSPKGPLLDWSDTHQRGIILEDLVNFAREKHAVFIKIDPDVIIGTGVPGIDQESNQIGLDVVHDFGSIGFIPSSEQIQFKNTIIINLEDNLDILLANLRPKTRYNVRLAERKGVNIRVGILQDLPILYRMYSETAKRDGFIIRDYEYYKHAWGDFISEGYAEALIAEFDGNPISGLIWYHFGDRAWFLFGMSTEEHRNLMPNYLLQWKTIERAKLANCSTYDMWGAPDIFSEEDPLWGVYNFKKGFNGTIVRHVGAYDLPINQLSYKFYMNVLPRIQSILRWRKTHLA